MFITEDLATNDSKYALSVATLNETAKLEAPCHKCRGTIKISPQSGAVSALHWPNIADLNWRKIKKHTGYMADLCSYSNQQNYYFICTMK